MSIIPAGWSRTRVFVSGCGPAFTVRLNNAIEDVVFATVVSVSSSSELVSVEGLNRSYATTTDASGNASRFNYFCSTPGAIPTDPPRFPTQAFGQTFVDLTINWLTYSGAIAVIDLQTVTYIELELWSYNN
jgi:hypothetical protein